MGYKDALGTLLSLELALSFSLFLSLSPSISLDVFLRDHQQPEVNSLPRFSPQISLSRSLSLSLPPRAHQPFSSTPSPACARISGRSNRLCQIIDLYLRSPESGGL